MHGVARYTIRLAEPPGTFSPPAVDVYRPIGLTFLEGAQPSCDQESYMRHEGDAQEESAGQVPGRPPGRVLVVGASAAGPATAEALRRKGYEGEITVLGGEAHAPYDRPPLSKQVL